MTVYANVGHILLKRGNTVQSAAYTGPLGEVTYDTDLRTLRVHDGSTVGGNIILINSNSVSSLSSTGNLRLTANTAGVSQQWTFGGTGTLTLPNGAVIRDTADDSVAFGQGAGTTSQGVQAVAIGADAGANTQGAYSVAIGVSAGANTQGSTAVAIGNGAGSTGQGEDSVAIGDGAGYTNQGNNSVAIGTFAGLTNQANNSIIINATGSVLNQTRANTFTVAPVRNDVSTANVAQVMFYNTTSKEVTYGNVISVAGNISTLGNITTANISLTGNTGFPANTSVVQAWARVTIGTTAYWTPLYR